jgi:hypothetical protein
MGFTEVACDDGKLSFIVQYRQYEVAAYMYFTFITLISYSLSSIFYQYIYIWFYFCLKM